ncbi:MAG: hypothetical protein EHM19_02495 [Candidatus Latescibacterota bacterium]|nr:MAG: hypothetical protein EHM19_02495 [Candidatus Latescibacterota bacterium]
MQMQAKRRVGFLLILSGAVTSLAALLVDYIGIDHAPGIGLIQIVVLAVGMIDCAIGLFFLRGAE